jgi:hypothetical protein
MIKIEYLENEIKVTSQNICDLYDEQQIPLSIHFINHVTKKTIWSTQLNNYSWVSFPNNEMVDTIVKDNKNKIVVNYNWDVTKDGSYHYKSFYFYCKNLALKGIVPKGIAIGTHNGEFGEWVPLVLENKIQSVLVEASEKQFNDLFQNFKSKNNTVLLNCLITTDGKEVEFFEGGKGYTNTIVEKVIRNWETEEIKSSIKSSISINDLILNYYPNGMDWLHLDVEGLDAKLIMSIEDNLLPNFIIFEDFNLNGFEKTLVYDWLSSKNYTNFSLGGICTSIRK